MEMFLFMLRTRRLLSAVSKIDSSDVTWAIFVGRDNKVRRKREDGLRPAFFFFFYLIILFISLKLMDFYRIFVKMPKFI